MTIEKHRANIEYLQGLTDHLRNSGEPMEGSASEAQRKHLAELASQPTVRRIGEIGFNAGISAYTFLAANPEAEVVSFDLARYRYWEPAKELIDSEFPDRHTLVIGDSTVTVPEFAAANPDTTFDLAFIDGGHEKDIAATDIVNMGKLAARETILIVDDISPWKPWGSGPTEAWEDALNRGAVYQTDFRQESRRIVMPDPEGSEKVWVVGGYQFGTDGLQQGPSLDFRPDKNETLKINRL